MAGIGEKPMTRAGPWGLMGETFAAAANSLASSPPGRTQPPPPRAAGPAARAPRPARAERPARLAPALQQPSAHHRVLHAVRAVEIPAVARAARAAARLVIGHVPARAR